MSPKQRPKLNYERRGSAARIRNAREHVVVPWTPARERQTAELDTAWKDWLASERAQRGNPNWTP